MDCRTTVREDLVPFGAAPGEYFFRCVSCNNTATGAKRSVRCEPCAVAAKDAWEAEDLREWERAFERATD